MPTTMSPAKLEQPTSPTETYNGDKAQSDKDGSAHIEGGMWVTRANGASEIARGRPVVLVRRNVAQADVADLLAEIHKSLEHDTRLLAQRLERRVSFEDMAIARLDLYVKEKAIAVVEALLDSDRVPLDFLLLAIRYDNQETMAAHNSDGEFWMSNEKQLENISDDLKWPSILERYRVARSQTGIDGKYRFDNVPDGVYALYANWESRYNYIEWCTPVVVEDGKAITVDLQNENAHAIYKRGIE